LKDRALCQKAAGLSPEKMLFFHQHRQQITLLPGWIIL
jgi:hypothetical protein